MNIKGIVHSKMKYLSYNPHVVPKPYDEFLPLKTPKRRYFE